MLSSEKAAMHACMTSMYAFARFFFNCIPVMNVAI